MHSQSYATFFRHSAVLSLPAVLMRKLPVIGTRKRQTATSVKINNRSKLITKGFVHSDMFSTIVVRPLIV